MQHIQKNDMFLFKMSIDNIICVIYNVVTIKYEKRQQKPGGSGLANMQPGEAKRQENRIVFEYNKKTKKTSPTGAERRQL